MCPTSHHTMEMKTSPRRGRLIFKGAGDDVAQPTVDSIPTPPSPPSGPMTRARTKALHDKVNSLLSTFDLGSTLDGMLLHSDMLCVIRYEPTESLECGTTSWIEQGREEVEDEEKAGNSDRIIRLSPSDNPAPKISPKFCRVACNVL